MQNFFWHIFAIASAFKALLMPAYHSTDFEVHRNWLAITHSLPLQRWYIDATSEWTLDYPPFFAYFEWLLSQVARFVDSRMLDVNNLNYASDRTIYFQRGSVIATDIVYAIGVWRCLRALRVPSNSTTNLAGALLLLLNVGLIFVDHIHFQYNGFLFGILLISIAFLLEDKPLRSAFTFALLINLKHIFLYMAPAFGVYLLRFYCLDRKREKSSGDSFVKALIKLLLVGLTPFVVAFGPFWRQLPQVLQRLFPFKRGLTHAYWAPNFWAIYNTADKVAHLALRPYNDDAASTEARTTAGLVQDFKHFALPTVTPTVTFILTALFMAPIAIKLLWYTEKSNAKHMFLRSIVLCSCSSFMFGWHVHEKAILMCLIPLCFLALVVRKDAKYAFILSAVGYFSLFPLLFHADLLILRYSAYLAYMAAMYSQIIRIHKAPPLLHTIEWIYLYGFIAIPIYEHILSPLSGLSTKMPFMPLLLTSLYASLGVLYFFIGYYLYTFNVDVSYFCCFASKTHRNKNVVVSGQNTKTQKKTKEKKKPKIQ